MSRVLPLLPNTLSLKYATMLGWTAQIVETIIPSTYLKRDLFGFADLIALKPYPFGDRKTLTAIQATSLHNILDRRRKVLTNPAAREWLLAGGDVVVWGWDLGSNVPASRWSSGREVSLSVGKKKRTFFLIETFISLSDFEPREVPPLKVPIDTGRPIALLGPARTRGPHVHEFAKPQSRKTSRVKRARPAKKSRR